MTTLAQFPPPPSLPRQYTTTTPDNREDDPEAWKDEALCAEVGGDMFFPEKGGSIRDAKKICESCDVRAQCLQYALDNHEDFGIWGGKSPRQRQKLRAAREDTVTHGTNTMYNRGCHNPATCPRSNKGTSCSEAHRRYDRKRRLTQGSAA